MPRLRITRAQLGEEPAGHRTGPVCDPGFDQVSLTALPWLPALEIANVHRAAVSHGAHDTGATRQVEQQATPTQLLSLALKRLPDLALSTFVVQALGCHEPDRQLPHIASQMRVQAAGAIRLCQRALEVHGRNVGYELETWSAHTLETASGLLQHIHQHAGEDQLTALGQLREATGAIARATAACENDRMAVPEHLSEAGGRLLLLFMLASAFSEHA